MQLEVEYVVIIGHFGLLKWCTMIALKFVWKLIPRRYHHCLRLVSIGETKDSRNIPYLCRKMPSLHASVWFAITSRSDFLYTIAQLLYLGFGCRFITDLLHIIIPFPNTNDTTILGEQRSHKIKQYKKDSISSLTKGNTNPIQTRPWEKNQQTLEALPHY